MRSKRIRLASVSAAACLLMLSFQNCGKAGFDSLGEPSLDLSNSNKTDGDPFAFEAGFDQITYNSCYGTMASPRDGFFTFRAGAYETTGVHLSQRFSDFVNDGETLKPIFPETTVSTEQIKNYLAKSGRNVFAIPQLSFRSRDNVQALMSPGGRATEGLDFISMLGDLTDDRWMHPLVTRGPSSSTFFFDYAPNTGRRLEGSLTYNNNEGTAFNLRTDIQSQGMLALTYRERPDRGAGYSARKPSGGSQSVAYGRGYIPTFEAGLTHYTECLATPGVCNAPNTPIPMNNPNNILSRIEEVNLENPSAPTATWNCDQKRRYTVVRPTDASTHCPADPVAYLTSASLRREYEIVRRHLSVDEWHVNLSRRCVVPKKQNSSCYENKYTNAGTLVQIEYDQRQPCYQDVVAKGAGYGNSPPARFCAQYISICNRVP